MFYGLYEAVHTTYGKRQDVIFTRISETNKLQILQK